ncbi:hypothetical protein [Archangium sp.]|uniref:hypothetical protein n=1 Tax=Archangium sp. TaxID=1872627 RepID=UPI00286A851D|nr:hypothetical protein [Archangium sp.]
MRPALPLLLLLAAAPVAAQDTAGKDTSKDASKEPKKKKVIRLDAITVEGQIQKPQAFYILQRSNLNFDELNKAESFTPKVVKSVEKEPF